jgi:hypothetical protein
MMKVTASGTLFFISTGDYLFLPSGIIGIEWNQFWVKNFRISIRNPFIFGPQPPCTRTT